MIVFDAKIPSRRTIAVFSSLRPTFWNELTNAANRALVELDADVGGTTVITSWFRTPEENVRVGGRVDSQHLAGTAFDIKPGNGQIDETVFHFKEAGFIATPGRSHVHVQAFPAGLLRAVGVFDALGL